MAHVLEGFASPPHNPAFQQTKENMLKIGLTLSFWKVRM